MALSINCNHRISDIRDFYERAAQERQSAAARLNHGTY